MGAVCSKPISSVWLIILITFSWHVGLLCFTNNLLLLNQHNYLNPVRQVMFWVMGRSPISRVHVWSGGREVCMKHSSSFCSPLGLKLPVFPHLISWEVLTSPVLVSVDRNAWASQTPTLWHICELANTLHPFTEVSSFQQLDSGTLLSQTQMDFYLSHFS